MDKSLYFGDNLKILRQYIKDESIDLIYLDPPFNSKADYNLLFQEKNGADSFAQITAFEDTWSWGEEAEIAYEEIIRIGDTDIVKMISSFKEFIKQNDMMAYLTMMTIRLIELKRVLKPSGNIYLHCDPTASHYLKVIMDSIFGAKNFRNEIIWCYQSRENTKKRWNRKHDVILFYSKSKDSYFDYTKVVEDLSENTIKKYRLKDENGRLYRLCGRGIQNSPIKSAKDVAQEWEDKHPELTVRVYLDEREGVTSPDWWNIPIITQNAQERLGYPTQKPRALLEKIILASCPKDGVVLDPFCGCGTTISACEYLNGNEDYSLKWIGVDITHLAIDLIKKRLDDEYNMKPNRDYFLYGEPLDLESAKSLAKQDRYQFQWWALSLVDAKPVSDKKKGADKGIDGIIFYFDKSDKVSKAIVQVKSGKVKPGDIRDLKGVIGREGVEFGVFITLETPTKAMIEEAVSEGFFKYELYKNRFPKLQIITIKDLLDGKKPEIPLKMDYRKNADFVKKKETTEDLLQSD